MKYEKCKYCGQNLDHGEKCDCQKEPAPITFENLLGELDTLSQYELYLQSLEKRPPWR